MITCTRKLWFSAGHRVYKHESVCAHPHGHNYEVHITATASELDDQGRIIDFGVLKEKFGSWIDMYWDHGFIFYREDLEMMQLYSRDEAVGWKHYVADWNPTAENIAKHLLHIAPTLLSSIDVKVISVTVFETPNCWASVGEHT